MYFMYVDESGDIGTQSKYFALSGLVVHESSWNSVHWKLHDLRNDLYSKYKLPQQEELHASRFLNSPGNLQFIRKTDRFRIFKQVIDFEADMADKISIINVICDKAKHDEGYDIFGYTWRSLIQRFENTIRHKNFPDSSEGKDKGFLIVDKTNEVKLRDMMYDMRRHNFIRGSINGAKDGNYPIKHVIEDCMHKDSRHSLFIQMSDVNAYFLTQKFSPSSSVKKNGAVNYFDRLDPVLNKHATRNDPMGIVWI